MMSEPVCLATGVGPVKDTATSITSRVGAVPHRRNAILRLGIALALLSAALHWLIDEREIPQVRVTNGVTC